MVMDRKKNTRIAIIGAGAAGLSAAYFLKKKGYSKITIFEKNNRVGGKCESLSYHGKTYELGACTLTLRYRELISLFKQFDLHFYTHHPSDKFLDLEKGNIVSIKDIASRFSKIQISKAIWIYLWQLIKYRNIQKSSLSQIPKELSHPFAKWAKEKGMEPLIFLFYMPVTLFGFGNLEEIPTIYILKYIDFRHILSMISLAFKHLPGIKHIVEGYARLWEKISLDFDVRLNTHIKRITREDIIRIYTKEESKGFEFDALIFACPLKEIPQILSISEKEHRLFSKVKTNVNRVISFIAEMPLLENDSSPEYSFYSPPVPKDKLPFFIFKQFKEDNFYILISFVPPSMSEEETVTLLEKELRRCGGRIEKIVDIRTWDYFPHVSSEAIAEGFYDEMEALQGQKNTYYTGSSLCFEGVIYVFEYSKALVQEKF